MKTLYLGIIICGIISMGIIMYFVINSQSGITTNKTFHETTGLPDYAIGIVFNGTTSSQDTPVYLKQGQNATVMAQITSNPSNLPASLGVSSHVGFTKTNGINSRLSDTKITTPDKVTIYVSATNDATPNTYKVTFRANNTLMTMYSGFYVKVIPSNEIRTVIVNDSRILGPCEIFRMPCPNNPTFTAQQVGSDTYIEKVTGNGVDHYAIVRPDRYCVYPPL